MMYPTARSRPIRFPRPRTTPLPSPLARSLPLLLSLALTGSACDPGELPVGFRATPEGGGPRIRWDLETDPIPEIPLPNDLATWPDPSSPTGRRLNASLVAPTAVERRTRELFSRIDGWGTFAPITLSFDAPLDTDELRRRQGRGRYGRDAFAEHAVYVIDLRTGIPALLDVDSGNFTFNLEKPDNYGENDPRGGESNLVFETVEEDLDGDGVLDPGEDTDFDGVLDHPNTFSGLRDPADPLDTYDHLMLSYERETDTLILRPIVPLEEQTEYAVVVTDRLVGRDGRPVRSPLPFVHHLAQKDSLARLPEIFAARPHLYGDLASRGWDGVAFAWTFTTQSVTRDLRAIRDGLYGEGPFARLARDFPPDLLVAPAVNPPAIRDDDDCTPAVLGRPYVAPIDKFTKVVEMLAGEAFGLDTDSTRALLEGFSSISHVVVAFVRVPYFLGDPDVQGIDEVFDVNPSTGHMRVSSDFVPLIIAVPKETEAHRQPFPVAFYGHGYTSNHLEAFGFAGLLARQGVATVGIAAQGHGVSLGGLERAVRSLFEGACLGGLGSAALRDRARDQNRDGVADSGGDFWTAYVFHTRDVIRQSVIDQIAALRALRALDGRRRAVAGRIPHVRPRADLPEERRWAAIVSDGDFDGDGAPDLAGDFDADGTPDIGGPDVVYASWGQSLGAAISGVVAGVEPLVRVSAPSAGAGGLLDVGLRTTESEVKEAVVVRIMGPLLMGIPAASARADETACPAGQISLKQVVVDLNDRQNVEFACATDEQLAEGDAVVVRNLRNGQVRCAGVGADGRFRVGVPADGGDPLWLRVYRGGRDDMDYATCTFRSGAAAHELSLSVDRWQSRNGSGAGACRACAKYMDTVYDVGSPLVAVTDGYGMRRQSPALRRFMALAQIAIEPADPINWAPRIFLRPDPRFTDLPSRSVLVLESLGDNVVPVNGGLMYARAAGVLPFLPADAPDEYADYRSPPYVRSRWGEDSPNDVLIANYVAEGIPRLQRRPIPGFLDWLFDPDDLSEGRQRYVDARGRAPEPPEEGTAPPRLSPPLRWVRESRPMRSPADDVWSAPLSATARSGISGVLHFMVEPGGEHGFDPPAPRKTWDEGEYLTNLLGWYFRSAGTELLYHHRPDSHHCLENSSCVIDR
jgi:hypothetical protein